MSRESSKFHHISVLYDECLEGLALRAEGTYVDCTLGGGGHASGILSSLGSGGQLIAFDKDEAGLVAGRARLEAVETEAKFELVHRDFADLALALDELGIAGVDGILADLGVSSHQLDEAERGFAFRQNGPLDMRMDRRQALTAEEIVATWSEADLRDCFARYGEERYAASVARRLVKEREQRRLTTTEELAQVIAQAMPAAARREKHPAKRCFQALRIAVNGELSALERLLQAAERVLNPGGRLCLISFHSLEDRLIKQQYREWEQPCHCPKHLPCVCGKTPKGRVIGRKGIEPRAEEQEQNPRARSARLRIFEWGIET